MSSAGAETRNGSPFPNPPSSLNSLPVELLKRIVDLVRAQDEAFEAGGLKRAYFATLEEEEDEDDVEFNQEVARGIWPFPYGQGTRTLSLVNKQLRELALPHRFETIKLEKLAKPFFRYGVLNTPIRKLIKRLDMYNPLPNDFAEIAWTLPLLPNLSCITLRASPNGFPIVWDGASQCVNDFDAGEMARQALDKVLPTLKELRLECVSSIDVITSVLESAPSTIRDLHIKQESPLFRQSLPFLVEALSRFDPETLSIDCTPCSSLDPTWQTLGPFTSLTTLVAPLGTAGFALLSLVERIAPNLTHLTLTQISNSVSFDSLEPSPALSKLTHLRPEGHYSFIRLTRFFSLAPLRTLTLSFNSQSDRSLQKILPSFDLLPSSLRRLRCEITSRSRPRDEEAMRTALAERGISFELAWTPSADVLTMDSQAASWSSTTTLEQEQRRASKEDCKWASRHADWLLARGDKAGMQELAETVRRIRERRILEQQ